MAPLLCTCCRANESFEMGVDIASPTQFKGRCVLDNKIMSSRQAEHKKGQLSKESLHKAAAEERVDEAS